MAQQYVISTYKSNKIMKLMYGVGNNFGKPKMDYGYLQSRFNKEVS